MGDIEPLLLLERLPDLRQVSAGMPEREKMELQEYFNACFEECFSIIDDVLDLYAREVREFSKKFMHEQKGIAAREDEALLQEISRSMRTA